VERPVLLSLKTKITTEGFEETVRFYEDVLGLTRVEEWDGPDDKGCILAFSSGSGEAYLEVYRGTESRAWDGLSLQFRTDDVEAFARTLPVDVHRSDPVERPWGSRYVYLRDPNGIQIILFSGGL
jgi:catechol 2,3-dioxygenase-like lactoylglutathione lyase family enzyme